MNAEVLTLIIRATRKAGRAAEALSLLTGGNSITIVEEAYGDLIDAAFTFCGEQVNELHDSIAYRLIQNDSLTDDQVADMLLALKQNETVSEAS